MADIKESSRYYFEYENKKYTLCFTEKTASRLNRKGFSLDEMKTKPTNMCSLLFWGALQAENPIDNETSDKILSKLREKSKLWNTLLEMYQSVQSNTVCVASKTRIGRNEICPCGSRIKYKHCCLK